MLSTLSRRLVISRLPAAKVAPSRALNTLSRFAPAVASARSATALSVRLPVSKAFVRGIAQDKEFAAVISSELKEEEVPTAPQLPEHYQLTHDVEGNTLIELKRKFEDEEITIRFQVEPPEPSYPEETDQEEDLEAAMAEHMTPEQRQAMELERRQMESETQDEEGEGDDNPYADAMLAFNVIVHKPKTGKSVELQCLSDQGVLFVNHVCTYDDGKLPLKPTADNDYKRTFLYQGPVMADLPQELRGQIAEYLARRGIDDDMAKFVLEYVWFKEQSEYVRFLKTLHSVVSA